LKVSNYGGAATLAVFRPTEHNHIEAFSVNGGFFTFFEGGRNTVQGATQITPQLSDAIESAVCGEQNYWMIEQTRRNLAECMRHSKEEFIRDLNQLIPHGTDLSTMTKEMERAGGPLSTLSDQINQMQVQITSLTRQIADQGEQLSLENAELKSSIESMPGRVADNIMDVMTARFENLMNANRRGIEGAAPMALKSASARIQDAERFIDHDNGLQKEMVYQMNDNAYGLPYIIHGRLNSIPLPSAGALVINSRMSSRPGTKLKGNKYYYQAEPIPTVARKYVTRALSIQSDDVSPFWRNDCAYGTPWAYLTYERNNISYHLEVSVYNDGEVNVPVIRGHSDVLRYITSGPIRSGVSSVILCNRGQSEKLAKVVTYGHAIVSVVEADMTLNSETGVRDVVNQAICAVGRDTPGPCEVMESGLWLNSEIGKLAAHPHVLARLSDNVDCPIRHQVLEFCLRFGADHLHDRLVQLGQIVAELNSDNGMLHSTGAFSYHLETVVADPIVRSELMDLYTFHSRAINGMPKGVHNRAGSISKFVERGVRSKSTIMQMHDDVQGTIFVCPSCGNGYATVVERQLCNAIEVAIMSSTLFADGIFPTVLLQVKRGGSSVLSQNAVLRTCTDVVSAVNYSDFDYVPVANYPGYIRVRRDMVAAGTFPRKVFRECTAGSII
jgi:hypothetical protein